MRRRCQATLSRAVDGRVTAKLSCDHIYWPAGVTRRLATLVSSMCIRGVDIGQRVQVAMRRTLEVVKVGRSIAHWRSDLQELLEGWVLNAR